MIPLYDLLQLKYPSATIGIDGQIQLSDKGDGEGAYINVWEVPDTPKPTKEDIEAWQSDSAIIQQYTFKLNAWANTAIYKQLEDIDNRSIRALRTNDTNKLAELEQNAVQLRLQLLPEK